MIKASIIIVTYFLLWILLPHIQVIDHYPFQSTLVRVLLLLAITLAWKRRYLKSLSFINRCKHYLRIMPLYIIIGNDEQLQINTTQSLKIVHHKLKVQFPESRWIFTDTATYMTQTCDALLRTIAKYRKNIPINGIITIIPINNINTCHDIKKQIAHLNHPFKHKLPIYLILTNTQEIIGFDEFFEDISYEEMLQPWGIHLEKMDFEHQYNQMISQLQKRTLWLMSKQSNVIKRSLIFNFPQQLTILKQPIANTLSSSTRGIYFCANNNAFNKQLIDNIILPENKWVGFSHHYKIIDKYKPIITSIILPVILMSCYFIMHTSLIENKSLLNKINTNIKRFQQFTQKMKPDYLPIFSTIQALDALHKNILLLNKSSIDNNFILSKQLLTRSTYQTYLRAINTLFIPRIAATLEQQLKNTPADNVSALYTLLKGYLAFSPTYYTNPQSIIAPMLYYWQTITHYHKNTIMKIRDYLEEATHHPLIKLPLNHPLINQTKQMLLRINPSQRAYALLSYHAQTDDITTPKLMTPFSGHIRLNPLYTAAGYQQILSQYINLVSNQVANDNNEINPTPHRQYSMETIKKQIYNAYNHHYVDNWQSMLMNIHLNTCNNLTTCIALGELMAKNNGPLAQLIKIIIDNTQPLHHHALSIDNTFKAYIHYSKQPIKKLQQDILTITNSLIDAKHSNDTQPYLLMQAKSLYQSKHNILSLLREDGEAAPKPISHIINQLIFNFRSLITSQASSFINKQWYQSVYPFYQENLANKFPITNNTNDQISMDHFIRFFGHNGIWINFYKQYLQLFKPYNNTIKRLLNINHQYFKHDSLNIQTQFKPLVLSQNSKSISILIGQKTILYQHGPRERVPIEWPGDLADNTCNIIFNDFQNNKHILSFTGAWSFFQCLNAGNLHYHGNDHYYYHIAIGDHSATFSLTTTAAHAAYSLKLLQSLHLSKTIITIPPTGEPHENFPN